MNAKCLFVLDNLANKWHTTHFTKYVNQKYCLKVRNGFILWAKCIVIKVMTKC